MSSLFDFSNVAVPTSTSYLKPGNYTLHVTEVKLEQPDNKTPYLNVTFAGQTGIVKQKFYLTPKALPNLQYLHEGFFGKPIAKGFDSVEQIHAYFQKALTTKKVERVITVGAQESDNGKLYAELPYGNFIVKEGTPFVEGEFEEGSARYTAVVRKNKLSTSNASLSTDSTMLPSDDSEDESEDSMPW